MRLLSGACAMANANQFLQSPSFQKIFALNKKFLVSMIMVIIIIIIIIIINT